MFQYEYLTQILMLKFKKYKDKVLKCINLEKKAVEMNFFSNKIGEHISRR